MIICGYQGVGKSSLYGYDNIVDLESSLFFNHETDSRPHDWYVYYCQIAEHLSKQGFTVLLSTHSTVRDYLYKHCTEKVYVVFPDISLKDHWIAKLESRYTQDSSNKNYKALANALQQFENNIMDMAKGKLPTFVITDPNYSLYKIIEELKKQ